MRRSRRSPTPLPPVPSCDQVARVLHAYLDGELGPQDAELVAEHLRHCDHCPVEAETVRRVVRAIRRQRPDLDLGAIERLERYVDTLADVGGDPS